MPEEREKESEPLMYKWECCKGCGPFEAPMTEDGRPDCPECHSVDTGDGVPVSSRETTT